LARKILLADDSVTAQNMGRKILADAGYEVITVNNGSAALKKIAEQKPDLIVLDVYMPGYSGLEVCMRLKEVKETARIPVLLTVGKLEPFKPEEAKRVKAEGYIVKPFEASELLSALSKLEDRVVPRADSAKPGRFARTIAAVEEGRSEDGEGSDSDEGWKNRIAFPSKKKKQAEEDESDLYKTVKSEMRTIVAQPAAPVLPSQAPARVEDARLDVAALAAAAGLPKDVTPEELTALAAAAAQVQAAVDGREPAAAQAEKRVEAKIEERVETRVEETIEARVDAQFEAKAESKTGIELPAHPVTQAVQPEVSEIHAGATFAGESAEPAVAEPVSVSDSAKESARPAATARDFEVIAAPAGQAEVGVPAPAAFENVGAQQTAQPAAQQDEQQAGQEAPTLEAKTAEKREPEKRAAEEEAAVTMAMAAAASAAGSMSRWTAVPVAVAAEEAGMSLELEMQKAYAAFAAAEANQPGFVTSAPAAPVMAAPAAEMPVAELPVTEIPPMATPAVESLTPATLTPEPQPSPVPEEEEIARTLRDVAAASAEAVDSTLAKLEAVAEAQLHTGPAAEPTVSSPGLPTEAFSLPEDLVRLESSAAPESAGPEHPAESSTAETKSGEPAVAEVVAPVSQEVPVPSPSPVLSAEEPASPVPQIPELPEAPALRKEHAGGEFAEKEKDMAAATAAAWANWRQVRESGNGQSVAASGNGSHTDGNSDPTSQQSSAMAVAAGAEKSVSPEDAPATSSDDPSAIASIVDKVLADLRPKIAEEISRKLGKK
jgi:CheY-like chemotaxis protein